MTALVDTELVTMLELSQSTQLTHVLRVWIKAGLCHQIGEWHGRQGRGGLLWSGEVWGYRVNFESYGQDLVPGSFSYRALPGAQTPF